MKTIIHYRLLTFGFVLGITVSGCNSPDSGETSAPDSHSTSADQRLKVGCTTNIVKDLVQQIGGEHVVVTAIMDGPAVDPHLYTPSPQDINALTDSDVVVYAGLHLEAQLEHALESLQNREIPTIKLGQILETEHSDRLLQADGVVDPHVWFDPILWSYCGHWLAGRLAEIDAAHAGAYQQSATSFAEQMQLLKSECQTELAAIPAERRVLVTAHDAFQYFARTFEFRVEAVQGLSTESEPGLKQINDLAGLLTETKIGAIFTEQSVSDRNIQALISACESRGHQLVVGGSLFSDTAGAAGTPEATLDGATRHNVREIGKALNSTETPAAESSTP